MISWVFPIRFQQICIISVSGDCNSETCQIVASISMTQTISQIFLCYYWRVFVIWNYCAAQRCHRWACPVTKVKNSHAQWKGARVLASNVTRAMQHITKLNQRKNMQVRFYNEYILFLRDRSSWNQNTKQGILFSPIIFSNFSQFEKLKKKRNFWLVQNSCFFQFASWKRNDKSLLVKEFIDSEFEICEIILMNSLLEKDCLNSRNLFLVTFIWSSILKNIK